MTINQYLWALEAFKIQREKYFEKYMRLESRATSPKAATIRPDGTPPSRSGYNMTETLIIAAAEAWQKYIKAYDAYESFRDTLQKQIELLDFSDRVIIREVYIWNLSKPPEKRTATLWGLLRIKKCDQPQRIEQAKANFREILRQQGIRIE